MEPPQGTSVNSHKHRRASARFGAGSPRLITVTTGHNRWTVRPLRRQLAKIGIRHDLWTYTQLFSKRRLPRATYVFTDFDRLMPWHIELAARIYLRLKDAGLTVLNDPRQYVPRWAYLRRLHAAGINDFTCWLPMLGEWPDRYPAFLRTVHAHRSVDSGLLQDEDAARAALEDALGRGLTLNDLVFVEYAAEPSADGNRYRKFAAYRIGDRVVRALTVTDDDWVAKMGKKGAASDADYAQDLAEHRDYPRADLVATCFDIAGMTYGRIDYGLVGGRPQIYELNTNPTLVFSRKHPNADRRSASDVKLQQFLGAFEALCKPEPGRAVRVGSAVPRYLFHGARFGQP
ncbi:MAG: hypothetical protein AAFX45_04950 [Pseudomonadota bacterium]